jgi:hypothetical protein
LAVGHGVKSCTQEVDKTDAFIVDEKPVVLVDCPGFDDSHLSDVEILNRIAGFLAATYVFSVICFVEIKLTYAVMYVYVDTRSR